MKKSKKGPGYIVKTQKGKVGRTYHSMGLIRGKIAVYLEHPKKENEYKEPALLCDKSSLKIVGYID